MLTSKHVEKHILNILKSFNKAYNLQTFQNKTLKKNKKIQILKKINFTMIFRISKKNHFFEVGNFKIFSKKFLEIFFVIFEAFIKKN